MPRQKFLVNNPLDGKENYEHALNCALHFPLGRVLLFLRAITVNSALITSDNSGQEGCTVIGVLTKLFTDVDMLLLLTNCQKPHTQLQIKGRKKSTRPSSCMKFCTLTPKIC
jgi:hypothetical protein